MYRYNGCWNTVTINSLKIATKLFIGVKEGYESWEKADLFLKTWRKERMAELMGLKHKYKTMGENSTPANTETSSPT